MRRLVPHITMYVCVLCDNPVASSAHPNHVQEDVLQGVVCDSCTGKKRYDNALRLREDLGFDAAMVCRAVRASEGNFMLAWALCADFVKLVEVFDIASNVTRKHAVRCALVHGLELMAGMEQRKQEAITRGEAVAEPVLDEAARGERRLEMTVRSCEAMFGLDPAKTDEAMEEKRADAERLLQ